MSDINLKLYPIAERHLSGELLDRYGVDLRQFNDAPIYEQARVIHQLFGYNFDIDLTLDRETLIDQCEDILYFYQSAILDGQTVIGDKTREPISWMPSSKLSNWFMEAKRKYLESFKDCLIPATKDYKMKAGIFETLKDCLVNLLEPIAPQMDYEKFWDEAIKFSWKVKSGTEKIPF